MARFLSFLSLLLLVTAVAETAQSQSILERARRAAERGAERAGEREAERRAERAVTGAIECVGGDRACAEQAQAEGQDVPYVDESGTAVSSEAAAPAAQGGAGVVPARATAPGEGAWANYDFVPGDRVLFAEDFSSDRVGNFPRRFGFIDGTMEIVETPAGRYLRATSDSRFEIELSETLPERFTIEFEAHLPHWWHQLFLAMGEPENGYRSLRSAYQRLDRYPYSYVQLSKQFESGLRGEGGGEALTRYEPLHEQIVPVRIMADGSYVKVFLNERRIANVPNANLARSNRLGFFISGEVAENRPVLIGNIRVAAGGPSLYDALQTAGRVSTQGILFGSGSDRIQPESTPTLKEIAHMLQQHPNLRLRIEGHTDNVGSADVNQRLSEQRAQAVINHLVQREGVAGGRLEAVGKGQAEPIGDNATAEGRQTNRRVDLVVLD